ncbi:hypothetical protein WJX72_012054 [[Myrmecia] bisecta]|uniref:BZIP domain-containing protein n=1 Tax=[Myrmecia] bisecta TaxID=41462 RepID=A0AAW1QSZ6_9CHLO
MDACDDELLSFLAPAAGADASRDASAGPASPQLLSASPETTAAVDNMLLARMHCQPYPAYHRPQMSLLSSPGELGGLDLLPRSPTLPHMAGGAHQAYMGSMLTGVPPATWRDQVPQPRSQQIHIMQAALPSTDPAASQQLRQILQQGSAALKCPMKHARRMSAEPVPMSRLGEDHEPSAVAPEVDGMQEARRVRRRRQNAEASQRSRQKKRLQRQLLQSQIAELQDAKDVVKRRIQAAACLPACAQTGARLAEDSGIYPYGGLEEQLAQLVTDLKEKRQELARLGVPKTGYRSN